MDKQECIPGHLPAYSLIRPWNQDKSGIIEGAQHTLVRNGPFEYRMRYTERLEEQLTPEMQDALEKHKDGLMTEFEASAEDIEIYVEREELQHTSKIDGSTGEDPQIGPGETTEQGSLVSVFARHTLLTSVTTGNA